MKSRFDIDLSFKNRNSYIFIEFGGRETLRDV